MVATSRTIGKGVRPSVRQAGWKAHRYLTSPGFSGRVIAAGSSAVYIDTDDGELLAGCSMNVQPHPRSFLTDLDLSLLQEGLRVRTEDGELRFSNGISLPLGETEPWHRSSAVPPCVAPLQVFRSRVGELLAAAQNGHAGENLGLALPLFGHGDQAPILEEIVSPLITSGVRAVDDLLPVCRQGDLEPVLQLSEQLIGLGPGLTPSGDDFVGGLIFMARHLNAAYPQEGWWRGGNVSGLLNRSETMTSRISHVLIADLAEGQSHESLHELADALVVDSESFDAAFHVRRVTSIGQSSGWDMLTGMLAGLLSVIYRENRS
jgi:hypothetical protein